MLDGSDTAATVASEQKLFVREMATAAVKEAGGVNEGATLLKAWAMSDEKLYHAITASYLYQCCHQAVRHACIDDRVRVRRSVADLDTAEDDDPQQGARLLSATAQQLMEFPMYGGKPMGDCTGDDLSKSEDEYRKRANTMHVMAEWARLVRPLAKKKTVREAVKPEKLLALYREAASE